MSKRTTEADVRSNVTWDTLEDWLRGRNQQALKELLEEEDGELLGSLKSERRKPVDGNSCYRNGYGKPRHLTTSRGTITFRRPRLRNLEERFESRVLPLFVR